MTIPWLFFAKWFFGVLAIRYAVNQGWLIFDERQAEK